MLALPGGRSLLAREAMLALPGREGSLGRGGRARLAGEGGLAWPGRECSLGQGGSHLLSRVLLDLFNRTKH